MIAPWADPMFNPAMVWPEPQPHRYPHQTTYGTDTMPHENPHLRPDRETINDLTHRLHEAQAALAEATIALGEKEIELREARNDAVNERVLGGMAQGQATAAHREAQRLRDANTELHRQLDHATTVPNASYIVHDPGVYVVTQHGESGIRVVKHLHRDAVVLTANPDEEPADWWQTYRDGITGCLTAWKPPKYLHELISHTAKHAQDPSVRPWMAVDRGKPGDDMTTIQHNCKHAVLSDAQRIDRLEAWARQFDSRRFELAGGFAGVFAVRPLDSMEPKA